MPDNQFHIPASFVDLFVPPGRVKPTLDAHALAERFEFCDDLAQMLTEQAQQVLVRLGITEADVLSKVLQGLLNGGTPGHPMEALWVVCRLAELLGWPLPPGLTSALPPDQIEAAQRWFQRQLVVKT